ncbi:MAG: three-Cys-motif partner protein TcmP [Gammaproteobacteria bacterium]|nr:three-Cys-motif partner protein TcmP [Gammaproteobacteria bacterium]
MQLDDDGLPLDEVGAWAKEKHDRLRKYIDIARATRKKFVDGPGGASYIDLFCGSGRAAIRDSGERIDGSPLLAFKCAVHGKVPFSEIHISDADAELCAAAAQRIANAGGVATKYVGSAEMIAPEIARQLNPHGLHFAFLDPCNLQDLPFNVIEELGSLKRMDMLIHVSAQDLQRNLHEYIKADDDRLDRFAPGWRDSVDLNQSKSAIRAGLFEYWMTLIEALGLPRANGAELVAGSKNQRLYWLVFVSRSDFAVQLWDKIRDVSGQQELF